MGPKSKSARSVSPAQRTAQAADAPHFSLPSVACRPAGWGPDPAQIPAHIARMPYAPFSKSDRLGRIADWTAPLGTDGAAYPSNPIAAAAPAADRPRKMQAAPGPRSLGAVAPAGTETAAATAAATVPAPVTSFAYQHAAEDDASFSVVDRSSVTVRKSGANRSGAASGPSGAWGSSRGGFAAAAAAAAAPGGPNASGAPGSAAAGRGGRGGRGGAYAGRGGRGGFGGRFADRQQQRVRDPSIKIGPTWTVVEELDFVRLSKLYLEYQEPEDVGVYGSVQYLDRTYERITAKSERPLRPIEKTSFNVTASEDPVMQEIARESTDAPIVFATDAIIAAIMTSTRSVYSFDIVITKKDNKLYLDKRDNGPLDFVNVNENAFDPPSDVDKETNINGPQALAYEATYINRTFSQQVLRDSERVDFTKPNPFAHGEPVDALASAAYRYRRWQLGDVSLVVRTRLDAAVNQPGAGSSSESAPSNVASSSAPIKDTIYTTLRALNEFDSRAQGAGGAPDWRQKIDSQRGAIMATELKNNSNKLLRWSLETVLSGAEQMRLGFVSRVAPRDRKRHVILGFSIVKPFELMSQMNYDMDAGWGIVKAFIDLCMSRLENGKYLLLRNPNKPALKLFHVVATTTANASTIAPGLTAGIEDDDQDQSNQPVI